MAPLVVTSRSGYSSAASLEAEYTEAPASLTMVYCMAYPFFLMKSATTSSVSLEAVPFPMTITSTSYFSTSFLRVASVPFMSFFG